MAKKIYVGNLSYDVKEGDLHSMFSEHGNVESASIIIDRETGRSKGFGFVEMGNDSQANAAIEALNGHEFQGRTLKVNEAKPRPSHGGGGGGGGGNRGGRGGGRGGQRSRY